MSILDWFNGQFDIGKLFQYISDIFEAFVNFGKNLYTVLFVVNFSDLLIKLGEAVPIINPVVEFILNVNLFNGYFYNMPVFFMLLWLWLIFGSIILVYQIIKKLLPWTT